MKRNKSTKSGDLTIFYDENNPQEYVVYDLGDGESLIGRSPKCQVALRFTNDIDEVHTKITIEDDEFSIEDQDSQRGTFKIKSDNSLIRLKAFKSYDLAPQTAFYLGKFKCIFRAGKGGKSTGASPLSSVTMNGQKASKQPLKKQQSIEDDIEDEVMPVKMKKSILAKQYKNQLESELIEEEEEESVKIPISRKSSKQTIQVAENKENTEIQSQKKFIKSKGQLPKQAASKGAESEKESDKLELNSQFLKRIQERLKQKEATKDQGNNQTQKKGQLMTQKTPPKIEEDSEEVWKPQLNKKAKQEDKQPKVEAKKKEETPLPVSKQNKGKEVNSKETTVKGLDKEAKVEEKRLEKMNKLLESIKEVSSKGKKVNEKKQSKEVVHNETQTKSKETKAQSKNEKKKEEEPVILESKKDQKGAKKKEVPIQQEKESKSTLGKKKIQYEEQKQAEQEEKNQQGKKKTQQEEKSLLGKRKANQVQNDDAKIEKKVTKKQKVEEKVEIPPEQPKKETKASKKAPEQKVSKKNAKAKQIEKKEAEQVKEVEVVQKKKGSKSLERVKEVLNNLIKANTPQKQIEKPNGTAAKVNKKVIGKKVGKNNLIRKTKSSSKEVEKLRAIALPNSIGIPRRNLYRALFSNSSVTEEQKKKLSQLGVNVLNDFDKPNEFNLVIADTFKRRVKLLVALNEGIPIVSSNWVAFCILEDQIMPYEPFIITKAEKEIQKQYSFDLAQSINLQKLNPEGVLQNVTISQIHDLDNITSFDVTKLVQSAGGVKIESYSSDSNVYYLSEPQKKDINKTFLDEGYKVVDVEGLLQSCLTQKNILDKYLITEKKKASKK